MRSGQILQAIVSLDNQHCTEHTTVLMHRKIYFSLKFSEVRMRIADTTTLLNSSEYCTGGMGFGRNRIHKGRSLAYCGMMNLYIIVDCCVRKYSSPREQLEQEIFLARKKMLAEDRFLCTGRTRREYGGNYSTYKVQT